MGSKVIRSGIVVLIGLFSYRYCTGIVTGEVAPVLATWVIFLLATQLSIITYVRSSEKRTLTSNLYGFTDALNVILVLVTMIFFGRTTRLSVTPFEIGCLSLGVLIALVWYRSQSHLICNLMIQLLMVVAYIPFARHLWLVEVNTETYLPWVISLAASSLGMIEPIKKKDSLAIVYTIRSTVSGILVLLLMLRLDFF